MLLKLRDGNDSRWRWRGGRARRLDSGTNLESCGSIAVLLFPSHAADIHAANEQDSEVLGEGNGEWNGNGNGNGNPTVE